MTNSNDPAWNEDQPELEPAGTIPVVGDRVCSFRGGKIVDEQRMASGPHRPDPSESYDWTMGHGYMQSEIKHCRWSLFPESWSENGHWRVFKRDKNPTESTEKGDTPTENGEESPESDLFSLAMDRVGISKESYGLPENSFPLIAGLWSKYLGIDLTPADVPAMMILMKLARHRGGHGKRDNWTDIAGYAYCGDAITGA